MNPTTREIDILVSEVGPRDGLQSIKRAMPTDAKHRWIAALAEAGLREIEVGSFVSPKLLPQMQGHFTPQPQGNGKPRFPSLGTLSSLSEPGRTGILVLPVKNR